MIFRLYVCACVCSHVCECNSKPVELKRTASNVGLHLLRYLRQSLLLPAFAYARLSGPQVSGATPVSDPHFTVGTRIVGMCHCVQLYIGFRDSNLNPHTHVPSALLIEQAPQPVHCFLRDMIFPWRLC